MRGLELELELGSELELAQASELELAQESVLELVRGSEPVLVEHLLLHMFGLCFYINLGNISEKANLK